MDSKFGLPIILVLVVIVVLISVLMAASDPFGAAMARDQAGIITAPAQVSISPLSNAWALAAQALIGLAGIILIGALIWFLVQRLQRSSDRWKSGPNANYARMPGVKPLSFKQMVEMMFYKSMVGDKPPQPPSMPEERQKAEF